jgi:hypothetical protein
MFTETPLKEPRMEETPTATERPTWYRALWLWLRPLFVGCGRACLRFVRRCRVGVAHLMRRIPRRKRTP